MKRPSTVTRVVRAVFRSLALVVLVAAFSLAAPLWGLTGNLVGGLTDEATCARMVKDWGLGQIVAGGLVKLEDLLPPHIMGYLQGDDNARGAMDELNRALGRSIDATAVEVASQVPAYIAGRREHLQASMNLSDFRQTAVNIAVTRVPGGRLMESVIRRGIESTVPLEFSLDTPLHRLEMLLTPVRSSVGHLVSLTDLVGAFSVFILMWIGLIGFRLTRIFRWIGAAFLGAGTLGALVGGLLSWFMGLVLPDVVLANRLFQDFMAGSILSFRSTAWAWMIAGGSSVVVSFVLSPYRASSWSQMEILHSRSIVFRPCIRGRAMDVGDPDRPRSGIPRICHGTPKGEPQAGSSRIPRRPCYRRAGHRLPSPGAGNRLLERRRIGRLRLADSRHTLVGVIHPLLVSQRSTAHPARVQLCRPYLRCGQGTSTGQEGRSGIDSAIIAVGRRGGDGVDNACASCVCNSRRVGGPVGNLPVAGQNVRRPDGWDQGEMDRRDQSMRISQPNLAVMVSHSKSLSF